MNTSPALAAIEAERTLLGAVLLSPELFPTVTLDPADFSAASHRALWAALRRLDEAGRSLDTVTLHDELTKRSELEAVGGVAYIAGLVDGMPRLPAVDSWAEIIRDRARKRTVLAAAERMKALALGESTAHDALEECARILQETAARVGAAVDLDVDGQLREALRALEESARGEAAGGWSTGLSTLDRHVGRLLPGQLVLVAGRTGLGKSTVLQNVADAIAAQGGAALLFSAEMTAREVTVRRLLAEAGVPQSHFDPGGITPSARDWEQLARAVGVLRERPCYVDASAPMPLEARAKARIVHARRGLAAVFFDYLQLMPAGPGRKGETREAEVARVSRALKRLAMDLGVVVVAASQLNRQSDQRKDGKPRLSDLRESGAQEQDADVVLLLHRLDDERDDAIEVQVAKHRNRGRSPWFRLAFDGATHRFSDPEAA